MAHHATAALYGRGASGKFAESESAWGLILTVLKAYRDAGKQVQPVLAERRKTRHLRRIPTRQFSEWLRRFRLTAKEAAWKE
jgi:hypothetical protein